MLPLSGDIKVVRMLKHNEMRNPLLNDGEQRVLTHASFAPKNTVASEGEGARSCSIKFGRIWNPSPVRFLSFSSGTEAAHQQGPSRVIARKPAIDDVGRTRFSICICKKSSPTPTLYPEISGARDKRNHS